MTGQYLIRLLGALLCIPIGSLCHAAIQGQTADDSSTAITTITLAIEPSIQISNVGDIALDVTDRNQDVSYEERICVRGNLGSRYNVIVASQDGSKSPFQLSTESGNKIGYEVYFRGDLAQPEQDRLFPGKASPYYAMQTNNQNCDGNDTAAFTIVFRSEQLLPAVPGIYSGFLTVTVAAE